MPNPSHSTDMPDLTDKKVKDMPVKKTKLPSGKVRVSTPSGVKAKATTPEKAKKQERLLNAVEHGWKPTGKKKGRRRMSSSDGFTYV